MSENEATSNTCLSHAENLLRALSPFLWRHWNNKLRQAALMFSKHTFWIRFKRVISSTLPAYTSAIVFQSSFESFCGSLSQTAVACDFKAKGITSCEKVSVNCTRNCQFRLVLEHHQRAAFCSFSLKNDVEAVKSSQPLWAFKEQRGALLKLVAIALKYIFALIHFRF